jgi:5-methylcytosine-specific restriction protein A
LTTGIQYGWVSAWGLWGGVGRHQKSCVSPFPLQQQRSFCLSPTAYLLFPTLDCRSLGEVYVSVIDAMRPTRSNRVIDLVEQAGLDVSDWGNFKGGPEKASANPRYCYEWSFVEPGRVVILNLWHDRMELQDGRVVQSHNFRKDADFYRSNSKFVWVKRALGLDKAIQTAVRDKLPIRVIVNAGEMRRPRDPNANASKVNRRELDSELWNVERYDWESGDALLVRGVIEDRYIDQFSLDLNTTAEPQKKTVTGSVFIRDPAVRQAVLYRAAGRCEYCGETGFRMTDGSIYLESHHVIPLSEGGPDTTSNVVALCPNHHREAHHGADHLRMREKLKRRAASRK